MRPNGFNQDHNWSTLSCVHTKQCTKNRSSNLSDFPSDFYTCALESFPAWGWDTWRKPGKTLRGSFSINTGGALSPPAAHNKLAGSCFPCLDRIRTGIMPDMSRGMTGGPRTRYIHPQTAQVMATAEAVARVGGRVARSLCQIPAQLSSDPAVGVSHIQLDSRGVPHCGQGTNQRDTFARVG